MPLTTSTDPVVPHLSPLRSIAESQCPAVRIVALHPQVSERVAGPDRSVDADARRMRWLLAGNGYYLEECCLPGGPSDVKQDDVRAAIDMAIHIDTIPR